MYEDLYTSLLEQEPSGRSGNEIRFHCPNCGSPHNKLYVNITTGRFDCKNEPDFHGGVYTFLHTQFNMSFDEIKVFLDDWGLGLDKIPELDNPSDSLFDKLIIIKSHLEKDEDSTETNSALTMPKLPTGYKLILDNLNNPESFPYAQYLNSRGVTYNQLIKHSIGYVVDGIVSRSDAKDVIVKNHIIFITYDANGMPIYWNSRSIEKNPYLKSLNGVAEEGNYSRRDVVFNLNNLRQGQDMVVCESVFNALTIDSDSVLGVATFGKVVTNLQVKLLTSRSGLANNYYLFLDTDAMESQYKLAESLVSSGIQPERVRLVINPFTGKDVNDLGKEVATKLLYKCSIPFNFEGRLKYMKYMKK